MRKNKFNSAADRRWQRRYERIQQRKEDEAYRKEMLEAEDGYANFNIENMLADNDSLRVTRLTPEDFYVNHLGRWDWISGYSSSLSFIYDDLVPEEDTLNAGETDILDNFLYEFVK